MKKSQRQDTILRLIETSEIDTQETLQALLSEHGVAVTQATVSRDIKELGLVKTLAKSGGYKYALPSRHSGLARHSSAGMYTIFADAVSRIDCAQNIVVVKCFVGMAQAVCAKIDYEDFPDVVGTIAGDDTIFILTRTEQDASDLTAELEKLIADR